MEPIIEFKNFSFKYRSQKEPTLKDINLKIYPGEKVLIIGPSGSGKSTLAHCINGLVPFSYSGEITGEYTIAGKDPKKLDIFELSKSVGTVLQDTDGQFIGLTVAEDLAFALENDEVPTKELHERVDKIAKEVDVKNLLEHAPTELSGGQKQRVSMGGVMISDVDILLLDEPLANLDPATGKHTMELIDEINKSKGTTIVVIEHRLEDALFRGADRIVVVGDGKIVSDSTPDELICKDILEEQGIREPLYVTAIKHAGGKLTEEMTPSRIDTIDVSSVKELVKSWHDKNAVFCEEEKGETILEGKDIYFSYDGKEKVLENVNFSVSKGEMLAIVGKNGAGKSTLSSLICGFNKPTSGELLFRGKDMSDLSIAERGEKIGLVMQNPNHMISKPMIFDEVALGLSIRGIPEKEIKERVEKILRVCGLYPFRNWPISALSFGQKKRVTIASILVMDPEIMILDEPTAGQDYRHYTEIMNFLKDINEKLGVTIIMITHDMHLMLEYTKRALVLADGKILADTTPARVLTDETLSDKAYLKKTSLYDLAEMCDIEDPTAFCETFIAFEQRER
ncbi:MAG: ABC transporter ATP-binding protein [Lachnospiraceae bacterium]|nr:ABC transporter ATP-binding protein [Lachnospiraceae bacterium]